MLHHAHACRFGAVVTPIVEFERVLLMSLELLGLRTFPRNSPIEMVQGVVQVRLTSGLCDPGKGPRK